MATRRIFLQMTGGLAGALVVGTRARAKDGNPIQLIQARIDDYHRTALNNHRANVGVVVGVVTPYNAAGKGQIVYAGQDTLTNPFGNRLAQFRLPA